MAAQNSMPTAWVTVTIHFRMAGTTLQAELPVPQGPTRLQSLLPALQALTDAVVEVGIDKITAQGRTITCKRENEIPAQTGPELLREVFTHLSRAAIPSNEPVGPPL